MLNLRSDLTVFIQEVFRVSAAQATTITVMVDAVLVLAIAFGIDRCVRLLVDWSLPRILQRCGSSAPRRWIDAVRDRLVVRRGAHLVAALLVYALLPRVLKDFPGVLTVARNLIEAYVAVVTALAINASLDAVGDVFAWGQRDALPVRLMTQATQGIVVVVGLIFAVSCLFDTSVTVLLSGLAGMTAVVMLLFKDTILGFVAGTQLATNDMLRVGDWIEVPQYGADGTVKDIRLTTVKVQNFDKTISTIPSYALVSESFKNWRGMRESGVRRIKRSLSIDMRSIRFLRDTDLTRLRAVQWMQPALDERLAEIASYNEEFLSGGTDPPNAQRLTNVGAFRLYVENYLQRHPAIQHELSVLVRHLEPGSEGLPIEIYVFSSEQDWERYERIQSSVFEHLLAVLPLFELQVFQLAMREGDATELRP